MGQGHSLLVAVQLVFRKAPFLTKSSEYKKVYAIDTGMINAIAFKFSENRGKLFENVLYLEFRRRGKEVYYYKTTSDREIDFLIKDKEKIELIQVCIELNEKAKMREVRALVQAAKELKLIEGILVTADVENEWDEEGIRIKAIPLYQFIIEQSGS